MEACPYKAFFDRKEDSINGLFSIVDTRTGSKLFNRLPVRSGQNGYTKTSWQSAKSPIPYSRELSYPLRINFSKPSQVNVFPTGGAIGEFWPVHNIPEDTTLIVGKQNGQIRRSIGCHPENSYPGSAGCIVFRWETPAEMATVKRLSAWGKSLIGIYEYIPLEVL